MNEDLHQVVSSLKLLPSSRCKPLSRFMDERVVLSLGRGEDARRGEGAEGTSSGGVLRGGEQFRISGGLETEDWEGGGVEGSRTPGGRGV